MVTASVQEEQGTKSSSLAKNKKKKNDLFCQLFRLAQQPTTDGNIGDGVVVVVAGVSTICG